MGSRLRPRRQRREGEMLERSKKPQPNTFTAQVQSWEDTEPVPWRIWKLIPAKVEDKFASSLSPSGTLSSGSLPPYDGDTSGGFSTRAERVESEQDEFGTIVNEVTVVTTTSTVTTRKKYRATDA